MNEPSRVQNMAGISFRYERGYSTWQASQSYMDTGTVHGWHLNQVWTKVQYMAWISFRYGRGYSTWLASHSDMDAAAVHGWHLIQIWKRVQNMAIISFRWTHSSVHVEVEQINTLRGWALPIVAGYFWPKVNVYVISNFLPLSFVLENFFGYQIVRNQMLYINTYFKSRIF